MDNSWKGVLLSGLVLPGLGQIVLKHYLRGALIMLTTLISLAVIVVKAAWLAVTILAQVEAEGGLIDYGTVSNAALQASTGSGSVTFTVLFALIIGCWVLGIVDAYRIGHRMDLAARAAERAATGSGG